MSERINATRSVLYYQDLALQPYLWDKEDQDFAAPYSVTVTPSSNTDNNKRRCAYFAFPIPSEYKYKKIRVRLRGSLTTNAYNYNIPQNLWVACNFFQDGEWNFPTPVLNNRVRSQYVIEQIGLGYEEAPVLHDRLTTTNKSHTAWPWNDKASGSNITANIYKDFDVYVGPTNYFAAGIFVKPSYAHITTEQYYFPCTVTVNDIYIEIDESVEPEDYNFFTPIYPKEVNVKQTNDTLFSWSRSYDFASSISSLYNMPLSSRGISYKKNGSSTPTLVTEEGDGNTVEIEANTFDIGRYSYEIVIYDLYENALYSQDVEFGVIGQDAAPSITNVTDDSIPTITWEDTNQAGYELILKDANQKIIYESGIVIGTNLSQKIPKMLENGSYIVEIREINIYGILSEWGSAEFTLDLEAADAPSDIIAVVNKDYGVEISGTPAEDSTKTFVVRKKARSEEIEVIGEYSGGVFTDYEVEGNTFYEYSLRNYDAAFADGAFVPVQVKVKEVVLHDADDFKKYIELHLSEENQFDIGWTEAQSKTLYRTLGRPYPVKEIGEWKDTTRTFKAFVKEEDWNKVLDMYYNTQKIYFKADHEFFACDMEITDKGRYIGGGYIIEFSITRISEDKEAII